MTWPFENDTTATIKKLAKSDLKAHKLKTSLTAIIIVIATCLMATIFSVVINDALTQASQAPYHAMYRAVNENEKSMLQNDPDFDAVGVYKTFGSVIDSDGRIYLAYMDEQAMSFMGFQLIDGTFPKNSMDVLVSETFLKDRALSLGDTFQFCYTDTLTNATSEEEFSVCGIIQNELQESGNQFYILTSDCFRMDYAERYSTVSSDFSTQTAATVDLLVLLNSERSSVSPEEQKTFLKSKGETAGIASFDIVVNDRYIDGVYFEGATVIGIIFFAVFLIFASSFVIYSIFYISVVNSMPMYAQFISLGTTEKQLRCFLKMQGNTLALRFVPVGMLLSVLIATALYGIRWIWCDFAIILFSGVLTWGVIRLALRKPAKLLAQISPIEAMKFREGKNGASHQTLKHITPITLAKNNMRTNRKKNRMSIVSLSISGTLMIALVILVSSINLPAMLRQSYPLDEDYQIGIQMDNFYERFPTIIQNNPLSDLQEQIYKIPGIEKIVPDECVIGHLLDSKVAYHSPEDNLEIINSLTPELISNVSEVVAGTINYADLGENDIVINKYRTDRSDLNYNDLKVGDTLLFQFEVAGQIVEKTFNVAGIAYFPSTGLFYSTTEAISAISPYDNISHLSIFCNEDYVHSVRDGLGTLISGNPNLRLKTYQEEFSTIEWFVNATMSGVYGVFAFVILFGLLNMVNMLISSAIIRKREFALLQAVGMTNQQLRKMLYREGMSISIKSALLSTILGITIGGLLCYLANKVLALKFIIFSANIMPALLFAIILISLQICISYGISRSIEKATLVERLRTE